VADIPLSDGEIEKLEAVRDVLRRTRDDADEAILAVETLIGLARRRRRAAPVTPVNRKDGIHE
jgi:hypothetical protein